MRPLHEIFPNPVSGGITNLDSLRLLSCERTASRPKQTNTPMLIVESSSDIELLDYEWLIERCLGNVTLAQRLVSRYAESGQQDCDRLRAAQQAGDLRTVRSVAHRLKGSSAAIGSRRMAQLADIIEQQSDTLDAEDLLSKVLEISQAHVEVSQRCRELAGMARDNNEGESGA